MHLKLYSLAFVLIASSLAFCRNDASCDIPSVKYKVVQADPATPLPKADVDRALVFVVRDAKTAMHLFAQSKVSVDGQWAAALKDKTYAVLYLAPGSHEFCSNSKGFRDRHLTLQVEAGKTYYLEQHMDVGHTFDNDGLELMHEKDGTDLLLDSARATMVEK